MDFNEMKQAAIELMDAVKSRGLAELSLEGDDFKLKIKANAPAPVVYASAPAAAPTAPAAAAAQAAPADAPASAEEPGTKVTAPLVGVFYSAPAPDAPPYIEVGQSVKKGDTLFIIEAMKTMNEISAPCDGTISRILAEAGDLVEFGQTLVVIA